MPCCRKAKKTNVQKVVIPKGMINPAETTVIEIPLRLQKQPVVIAKKKVDDDSFDRTRPMSSTRNESFQPRCTSTPYKNNRNDSTDQTFYSMTTYNSKTDLDSTERHEREQLQKDLEEFQRARRKLIANASHLSNKDPSSFQKSKRCR